MQCLHSLAFLIHVFHRSGAGPIDPRPNFSDERLLELPDIVFFSAGCAFGWISPISNHFSPLPKLRTMAVCIGQWPIGLSKRSRS